MQIPNPFKNETRSRNDDTLQKKWSSPHNPQNRGDIDFTGDPGHTDPSHARDCDINNIVATYHKTGVFPGVDVEQVFADVSDAPTFMEARNIVANAQSQFEVLDAKIRRRFDNDIVQFLDFVENPANGPELVKMGLATIRRDTPSESLQNPTTAQSEPVKKSTKGKPPVETSES